MALFKIETGLAADLVTNRPQSVQGYCYFTPDDGKFYIDVATGEAKTPVQNGGKLEGATRIPINSYTSDWAVRAYADENGKNIASSYGTSLSISGYSLKLLNSKGATLNSISLPSTVDAAAKLTSSAGSATKPIYFKDGKPTQCGDSLAVSVTGNAGSATKLATARKINGTDFDGTAPITTAIWGATRTLTIGNTGKSVNGNENVSWSLAEIGALPLTGGTLSGNLNFSNANGAITWNTDTYQQRIQTTDDSNANTAVFSFQQSSDAGQNWNNLFRIFDNGNVYANSFVGNLKGNADTATNATKATNALGLYLKPANRQTSANINLGSSDFSHKITYMLATSSMTTGKPPVDGHILSFGWDSTAGWGSQLAIGDSQKCHLYLRGANGVDNNSSWESDWRTVLDSGNYNSYAPTKTGGGASGTWGIAISGNAATATKFSSAATVALTGDITGTASSQKGWSIATTIGQGKVTNGMLAGSIANEKLAHSYFTIKEGSINHNISLGGSVLSSDLTSWLGLSKIMSFIGISNDTALVNGFTGTPTIVDGQTDYTDKTPGDTVLHETTGKQFIWTGSSWREMGEGLLYDLQGTAAGLIGTLDVAEPAASGTGLTFIATASQNNGKIAITKKTVQDATTSQKGVLQFTAANTNAQLNQLTTGESTPTDNDYYISQYAGGGTTTTSYHRRPVKALAAYMKSKLIDVLDVNTSTTGSKATTFVSNVTQTDGKIAVTKSELNTAGTWSGNAGSASKLTTEKAGATNKPVYFADGIPKAISYEINKAVPANAVFTDTKNTAGSTDTSSKIFLVGATSQAANPQTYSDNEVYALNGTLAATGMGRDSYIAYPKGGVFTTSSSSLTGFCKIILPVSWTNTMMSFKVTIYNYAANESVEYFISGYNYATTPGWTYCSAVCLGKAGATHSNLPVRFGHDGTKCVIAIGEDSTTWQYPQVVVHDVLLGYSQANFNTWNDGWSIVFDNTALTTVSNTITNTHVTRGATFTANAHTHTFTPTTKSVNSISSAGTMFAASVSGEVLTLTPGTVPTYSAVNVYTGLTIANATVTGTI